MPTVIKNLAIAAKDTIMTTCPCNPEKEFTQCCGPYLDGSKPAPTAEALMRSRYSAYTRRDYPYILRTCHSSTRPSEEGFDDPTEIGWTGLEILATEAGGTDDVTGVVEFVARFENSGRVFSHHERSRFVQEDGQWFYVDGDMVVPAPVRSAKVGRNEPCPCGSGKKYKKCCAVKAQADSL